MKNLINFLKGFKNFLVFVILQVIVLSFFFNSKNYHKASFVNTTSQISSWVTKQQYEVVKHFSLSEANKKLLEKNAQLMAYQPESFYHLQNRVYQIEDSLYEQQYEYVPATVIKTSITRRNNYITIDKGELQNIEVGMGVISNSGIVGFVVDVSPHFALVKTVLSDKMNISAQLKDQPGVRGRIKWDGADYKIAQLHGITNDITLNKGEEVITKGAKGIFPEGIPIGKIKKFANNNGEITYDIDIELKTDFKNLNSVYVIKNRFKMEIDELEKNYLNE
jgi:rod shape-determining protein MreC